MAGTNYRTPQKANPLSQKVDQCRRKVSYSSTLLKTRTCPGYSAGWSCHCVACTICRNSSLLARTALFNTSCKACASPSTSGLGHMPSGEFTHRSSTSFATLCMASRRACTWRYRISCCTSTDTVQGGSIGKLSWTDCEGARACKRTGCSAGTFSAARETRRLTCVSTKKSSGGLPTLHRFAENTVTSRLT